MRLARRMLAMGALDASAYPEVTAYYSSPGGAGDYLDAATNAAARAVFGGAAPGTFTVMCFARNVSGAFFMTVRDNNNTPYMSLLSSGELDLDLTDALASSSSMANALGNPGGASWLHCAAVANGLTLRLFADGVEDGAAIDISGMTFSASDILQALVANSAGDVCQPAIVTSAVSAASLVAVAAAGPSVDIRNTIGAIDFLWRDADTAGSVANVGTGAACALTIHGSVTSEAL